MSRTIETTTEIAAPAPRVWSLLTGFAELPAWSRFILSIEGQAEPGSRLTVRLDNGGKVMTVRPELQVLDERGELRWLGTVGAKFLFAGEHYFKVEALPDGRTRLIHGEIFSGVLVPLLWKQLDTKTRFSFEEFNAALRARAEDHKGSVQRVVQ